MSYYEGKQPCAGCGRTGEEVRNLLKQNSYGKNKTEKSWRQNLL